MRSTAAVLAAGTTIIPNIGDETISITYIAPTGDKGQEGASSDEPDTLKLGLDNRPPPAPADK